MTAVTEAELLEQLAKRWYPHECDCAECRFDRKQRAVTVVTAVKAAGLVLADPAEDTRFITAAQYFDAVQAFHNAWRGEHVEMGVLAALAKVGVEVTLEDDSGT